MNDTNRIIFNVTSDAGSFDANRFRIVFGKTDMHQIVPEKKSEMKVFPNPVKDQIHLQLTNIEKGEYALRMINSQGQQVLSQVIIHDGTSANVIISFNKKFPAGIYFLQLANKKDNYRKNIFIE